MGGTFLSPVKRLSAVGDSITKRTNPIFKLLNADWPTQDLQRQLGGYCRIDNRGRSGDRLADILARWNSDIAVFRPSYVMILAGLNDVRDGRLAVDIQTDLATLYSNTRAWGGTPIGLTITPWTDGQWTLARETERQAVNTWINNTANVVNVNLEPTLADTTDPAHPVLLAQYTSDQLHLSQAGARAVAGAVFAQAFGSRSISR